MKEAETLTDAQRCTLRVLGFLGGWTTYATLQKLGGFSASVPKLMRLGLVVEQEVDGRSDYPVRLIRTTIQRQSPNSGAQLGAVSL